MKKYLRLTLNERIQHLNLFINFSVLVITGFALKYPEAFWASPITDVSMGMTFRGLLHRLSGVAIVTLGLYHVAYMTFTRGDRGMLLDMIPRLKDARDFWETLKNNLFINLPAKVIKMGRFNFRQKLEYYGLIWGTVVMTITGFVLWFKEDWLKYFPMWTFDVARAIHFYEAVLATLTIFVWHFYSVIFDPDVYPMKWAWITGSMTEHEMELEHGLWLEKIKFEEKQGLKESSEPLSATATVFHSFHEEGKENFSIKRFLAAIQSLNEAIRNWKGV